MRGALEGLRVLDLSRYAPGPYATMLFADLGADVIMVEQRVGDGRNVGEEMGIGRKTMVANPVRRNKRSIALDLKNEKDRATCLALIAKADIVVEGFRPGVTKRLGVDYETVSKTNPGLVYCSVSGYGQTGPYRDVVGHDLNYISIAGVLGMVGQKGGAPTIPTNIIGDFAGGGLFAAFAIMAAINARTRTGKGQYVDMAMSDGALSLNNLGVMEVVGNGKSPRPGEYFLNGALPCYHVYETADGKWMSVGCMEPWFWAKLCKLLGCEQYATKQFNPKLSDEIIGVVKAKFKEKTQAQWVSETLLEEMCVTPVLSMEEVMQDPHNLARGMVVEFEDPEFGTIRQVGIAPKFSDTPGGMRWLPPEPGQHTEEILRELNESK